MDSVNTLMTSHNTEGNYNRLKHFAADIVYDLADRGCGACLSLLPILCNQPVRNQPLRKQPCPNTIWQTHGYDACLSHTTFLIDLTFERTALPHNIDMPLKIGSDLVQCLLPM
jgi:hypothetical protein